MKPKELTTLTIDSFDEISYSVTFYNKRTRNSFNFNVKKLLQNHNIKFKEMCYNEFPLPILEESDTPINYHEIKYCFDNKDDRKVFVNFIRENLKGYYE